MTESVALLHSLVQLLTDDKDRWAMSWQRAARTVGLPGWQWHQALWQQQVIRDRGLVACTACCSF